MGVVSWRYQPTSVQNHNVAANRQHPTQIFSFGRLRTVSSPLTVLSVCKSQPCSQVSSLSSTMEVRKYLESSRVISSHLHSIIIMFCVRGKRDCMSRTIRLLEPILPDITADYPVIFMPPNCFSYAPYTQSDHIPC